MKLRLLLQIAALAVVPCSLNAAECSTISTTSYSPGKLDNDLDHVGKLAWFPAGWTGSSFHEIEGCVRIPLANRSRLWFKIGGAVEAHSDLEKRTFVLVQIVRVQNSEPQIRLRISRFGAWRREAQMLTRIDDQPVQGLSVAEFFAIHEKMSSENPGDQRIHHNGNRWHAELADAIYSTVIEGSRFTSPILREYVDDRSTVFSNWLFHIVIGSNQATKFFVDTFDTKEIIIRTFSPNRSEFDRTLRIVLVRQ